MKHLWLERWQQLAPREQWAIQALGWMLAIYGVVAIAVTPALDRLQNSTQIQAQLEGQRMAMQQMAQAAQALKKQPLVPTDQSWRALQAVTEQTKGIQIRQQSRRVMVELNAVSATELARWLSQARQQAQSTVQEVHLTPKDQSWSGQMILLLPGQDRP